MNLKREQKVKYILDKWNPDFKYTCAKCDGGEGGGNGDGDGGNH